MSKDQLAKAREQRRKNAEQRREQRRAKVAARAERILGDPGVDPELKRKLAYCQGELAPGRPPNGGLEKRREELIAEAERRIGR